MPSRPQVWWVTANMKSGWHWQNYFDNPQNGLRWGGRRWIRSDVSRARIARMRRSDSVICYQAGEGVVGFTRLKSSGYGIGKNPSRTDMFDLATSGSIQLSHPVPLSSVRALPSAKNIYEFLSIGRGTVFLVEPGGFERLIGLAVAFNPDSRSRLLRL
jgi:hypothetical protein